MNIRDTKRQMAGTNTNKEHLHIRLYVRLILKTNSIELQILSEDAAS